MTILRNFIFLVITTIFERDPSKTLQAKFSKN